MEKNCFGIAELQTTPSALEERARDEYVESKHNIKKFAIEIILALLYSILYCKFISKLSINETVSYISEVSFPFNELLILIYGNYNVITRISYHNDNYTELKFVENRKFINLTSELKASKLILNKEFEGYLSIFFKIDGNKELSESEEGQLMIVNKIFTLNSSDNDIRVEKIYRKKSFDIKEELISSKKKKEIKRYKYDVHSHSIQTLNENYNFPVIDDNEKVSYFHSNEEFYNFGIYLSKKNYLSEIKITGDSIIEKWFDILGTMAAITEFVYPFLLFIKDKMKMASIKKVSDEKKPFKDNETNNDNKNFELNEIDKNI